MVIKNAFKLEQTVWLKTDPEQLDRLIIMIQVNPNGLMYVVVAGDVESVHYECEILESKNVI